MKNKRRILIDPRVQHGKPVIKGTRLPVARILSDLAGGVSKDQIQREYKITEEDIEAALAYAADLVEGDQFHPLPASRS